MATEMVTKSAAVFGSCPLPIFDHQQIVLGHGSGGKLTADLIDHIFLPAFKNPALDKLDDQAVVTVGDARLAFTTDSFVVTPIFFPGGDIGRLAVHGTVNDLAMSGARPLYLSAAFILEEGLAVDDLRRVVESMRSAAAEANVQFVTGDTKVVNRGKGDQIFITTTGIGVVEGGVNISADRARAGDQIILSGYIGDHGMAIMSQRENLEFEGAIVSDCASLHGLVASMLSTPPSHGTDFIHCLRDPTRGGAATTLNEIAKRSCVGMLLREPSIPVRESVKGACELCRQRGKVISHRCTRNGACRASANAAAPAWSGRRHHWRSGHRSCRYGADEDSDWRHQGAGRNVWRATTAYLLIDTLRF
jgi:hydrogenase expression/formation protein HypE